MSAGLRETAPAVITSPVASTRDDSAPQVRSRQRSRARFRARLAYLAADIVLLHLGFLLAYLLRYEWRLWFGQAEFFDAPFSAYFLAEAVLLVVVLGIFARRGLYRLKRTTQWLDEVGIITTGATFGISVLVMVFYLFRPGVTSRAMLFYSWILIMGLLSLFRLGARLVVAERRKRGIGLQRVLVVGAGRIGKMILQQLAVRPSMGYDLVGFCDDVSWTQGSGFGRFSCLGPVAELEQVLNQHRVDEVVIALPSAEHEKILEIVSLCQSSGVGFQLVPDTFDLTLGTIEVDNIAGIPLIGLRESALRGVNQAIKRAMDIAVAGTALVASAPIMLLVAIAVKLDSRGGVFYPQERVGAGGKVFRLYKVRSMYSDADKRLAELRTNNEAGGPTFKMKDDPRRTRVGRIIRRFSLDEVPQFWNVFLGHISVVGPRAPIPAEVEQYEEWHHRRLEVTPGLTGLWQVSGRSELPFDEMVMLDIYYIENWSLWLDLKIMLQTIPAVIGGRGAY